MVGLSSCFSQEWRVLMLRQPIFFTWPFLSDCFASVLQSFVQKMAEIKWFKLKYLYSFEMQDMLTCEKDSFHWFLWLNVSMRYSENTNLQQNLNQLCKRMHVALWGCGEEWLMGESRRPSKEMRSESPPKKSKVWSLWHDCVWFDFRLKWIA